MTVLDLSNIVNVSLTGVPKGLSNVNMNSVGFLTNEIPSNIDTFRIYLNSRDVATDYGSNSETFKMANALFSQSPNILSGGGRLVIAPMIAAVKATSGKWVTPDISANLAALIAVSNGDLRVTVDAVNYDLTGINLTGCTTLADIVVILQRKLPNAIITSNSTTITITSKKVGTTSTVVALALPAGTGTDLSVAGLLHTATGVETNGVNSSGETLAAALLRVSALVQFVGWFTNLEIEDTVYLATAAANQPLGKIFVHSSVSTADIAGICSSIGAASYFNTKCLLYTSNLTTSNLLRAAYVGRACSVNFSGSNTFSVMFLKNLVGLSADDGITQTIYDAAKAAGVDTYDDFGIAGMSCNRYGSTGLYFDEVYGDLWLQFALQIAGFNALATTSTKVPQTEKGMTYLKSVIVTILKQGVTVGYIGVGLQWNSSQTFGDPETLKASITAVGYFVYSLPISQQSQNDREARISPTIQIAIKRAGATQHVDVLALVEA